MESMFTKEYRINKMGYTSIGTIGKYEWLINKTNNGYNVCGINQLGKVELGTEQYIKNEVFTALIKFNS